MAKILTDGIIPALKEKVLTDTKGSVGADNLDWVIEAISFSYVNPKIVNHQVVAYRFGKLILISGVFQVNGTIAAGEHMYEFSDINLLQRLVDGVWVFSSNAMFYNGVGQTYNNSWQSFTGFGFIA